MTNLPIVAKTGNTLDFGLKRYAHFYSSIQRALPTSSATHMNPTVTWLLQSPPIVNFRRDEEQIKSVQKVQVPSLREKLRLVQECLETLEKNVDGCNIVEHCEGKIKVAAQDVEYRIESATNSLVQSNDLPEHSLQVDNDNMVGHVNEVEEMKSEVMDISSNEREIVEITDKCYCDFIIVFHQLKMSASRKWMALEAQMGGNHLGPNRYFTNH
ncbi:putative disease resistance RPP8-like protein 2 [Capsicum annuum]